MTDAAPLRHLARLIEEASGNVIPEGHLRFLQDIAAERARGCGLRGVSEYVQALARGALADEWTHLLPRITVNESYFFRTAQHFDAVRSTVLPALLSARAATRCLRVWSAGCARGEEPATLAIVLSEIDALAGWEWRIVATDVDERALAEARAGEYAARAVQTVPGGLRDRYFHRRGETFVLDPAIRARIDFHALNLIREPYALPVPPYDLIFLRNVLIYFRPESQRRVVANMARSLAADGYFFLGPSETLWQLSDELEPEDLGDCFCYRPRRAHVRAARRVPPPAPARHRPADAPPARRPPPPAKPPAPRAATTGPAPTPRDTRARVEGLARLLAAGDLEGAAQGMRAALDANPTDAALRGLEGLAHDLAGRLEEAAASYRAALFLDPQLFQVRLLLADALRRLGWQPRARHEYREVLATLATGRARELEVPGLPLPDRTAAQERCRSALTHR